MTLGINNTPNPYLKNPLQPQQGFNGVQPVDTASEKAAETAEMFLNPIDPKNLPYIGVSALGTVGIVKAANSLFNKDFVNPDGTKIAKIKKFSNVLDNSSFAKWIDSIADKITGAVKKTPTPKFAQTVKDAATLDVKAKWALARMPVFAEGSVHHVVDTLRSKVLNNMDEAAAPQAKGVLAKIGGAITAPFKAVAGAVSQNGKLSKDTAHSLLKQLGLSVDDIAILKKGGEEAYALYPKIKTIPSQKIVEVLSKELPAKQAEGIAKSIAGSLNKASVFNTTASATTRLGRFFQKSTLLSAETATFGLLAPAWMTILNAWMMAGAVKKTMKAPKGEKMSTFMEEMANNFGNVIMLPIAMKAFYKFSGIRFMSNNPKATKEAFDAGMKTLQTDVTAHKDKLRSLKDAFKSKLISKADYSAAVQAEKASMVQIHKTAVSGLKNVLKQDTKLWHKPFRFIGRVLGVGLHNIPAVTKTGKIMNFAKAWGGGIGRLVLIGFGLGALMSKVFIKGSHMVFGKPTHSLLDEGKEVAKTPEAAAPNVTPSQQAATQMPVQAAPNAPKPYTGYIPEPTAFVPSKDSSDSYMTALEKADRNLDNAERELNKYRKNHGQ